MGFDRPQRIYRAAFGRELALPVWVDIMNAAAQQYPPRDIVRPANLKEVEICSRSGLLATDKCYDAVKTASGDTVQRRTTYMEIATPTQMPTDSCNVHGESRARLVRDLPSGDLPRAELAVDLSEVTPVIVKSPTLLADKDPYNSLKPTLKPEPEPKAEKEAAENAKIDINANESRVTSTKPEKVSEPGVESINRTRDSAAPIRKAILVEPQEKKTGEIRRAIPVKPLDQVNEEETLLKSATPSPSDLDD